MYSETASPQIVCATAMVSTSWEKNAVHALKSDKVDGVFSLTTSEAFGSKWQNWHVVFIGMPIMALFYLQHC